VLERLQKSGGLSPLSWNKQNQEMKIQQENIREYPKISEICEHFLS